MAIGLTFLTSCMTLKYYNAEILLPAPITLSPGVTTVALTRTDSSSDAGKLMSESAFRVFQELLGTSQKFQLIDLPKGMNPGSWTADDTIRYQGEIPRLVFEAKGMTIDSTAITREDGYLHYTIFTETYWNIYDLTDLVIYPIVYTDTIDAGYYTKKGIPEKELPELYRFMGTHSGELMAGFFCPAWQEVGRMYFSSPTWFKGADRAVKVGDFLTAAGIWQLYAYDRSDRIAARACYNLALAAEMSGENEVALAWLEEASKRGLKTHVVFYEEIIKSRQGLNQILDQQMGVNNLD